MTKTTSYYPVTSFPKWRSDVVPSLRIKTIIREKKKKKKTHAQIDTAARDANKTKPASTDCEPSKLPRNTNGSLKPYPSHSSGVGPVELGLNPEPLSNFQSCMSFFYLEFLSVSLETNSIGGLFFIFVFFIYAAP